MRSEILHIIVPLEERTIEKYFEIRFFSSIKYSTTKSSNMLTGLETPKVLTLSNGRSPKYNFGHIQQCIE